MIRFGRAICGDLAQAERREWYLSNRLGGYAAGTIAGSLTRRYHGLLITPLEGVLDRHLVFAKAEPILVIGGRKFELGCNRWQSGSVAPHGYLHIESFCLEDQMPVWVYAIAGVRLEQRIFMEQHAAAVWVMYRLLDAPGEALASLQLSLWVNRRDHHGQISSGGIHPRTRLLDERTLQLDHEDGAGMHIQLSTGALQLEHNWIDDLLLPLESERGLPDRDHHLAVAQARMTLHKGSWQGLRAGLRPGSAAGPLAALQRERQHAIDFLANMPVAKAPQWIEQLIAASRQFLFQREFADSNHGESVIAGYPWFGDWGRDTMIALPGLALVSGHLALARRVLETWAASVDQGMIPNRFPESASAQAAPEYNSVDASLWFILAWHAYLQAGGEESALRAVLPVLEKIIDAYYHGTRYGIHVDEHSGLLHLGEPGTQLTWMDARVDGRAATPRTGKPVEVNALWYNSLCAMQGFCEQLGHDGKHYADMAAQARTGFQRFVQPEGGLFDVLDAPDGDDARVRPNQVFALSLPWPLLEGKTAETVLDTLQRRLYTSFGLRSLAADDPAYCGVYAGGVARRDAAYHNGPVWGWLLGHFAMAHFRVHRDAVAALALLEPMRDHLFDAGLGSISEIFDGDPPHHPRGAPSQAWSVATLLQAWRLIEDGSRQRSGWPGAEAARQ
ncbi:MAG: amylo-alpha-1,6-glucosidase [Gammaproteobacteria bacterium]